MTDGTQHGGRRGSFLVAAAAVVALVVGVVLIAIGMRSKTGPPQPADDVAASRSHRMNALPPTSGAKQPKVKVPDTPRPATKTVDFGPVLAASDPVALTIPSIGVRATSLVNLGLAADGTIEVPENAAKPGWFSGGPSPGQFGPAVIVGHVDSINGPAVFYPLGALRRGKHVQVERADGSTATFVVDRVEQFDKATFPTHEVYGDTTGRAELRLITCGGAYDEQLGYLGNVVAFAHLVSAR